MIEKELKRLEGVLKPLQVPKMPLAEPPPRDSGFGSPLKLSLVHWVRPEVVVEVTYLTWTKENLLRQVSYQGQREDKPARQVVRRVPHPRRPRWPAGKLFCQDSPASAPGVQVRFLGSAVMTPRQREELCPCGRVASRP
jgi:hypothetical protein